MTWGWSPRPPSAFASWRCARFGALPRPGDEKHLAIFPHPQRLVNLSASGTSRGTKVRRTGGLFGIGTGEAFASGFVDRAVVVLDRLSRECLFFVVRHVSARGELWSGDEAMTTRPPLWARSGAGLRRSTWTHGRGGEGAIPDSNDKGTCGAGRGEERGERERSRAREREMGLSRGSFGIRSPRYLALGFGRIPLVSPTSLDDAQTHHDPLKVYQSRPRRRPRRARPLVDRRDPLVAPREPTPRRRPAATRERRTRRHHGQAMARIRHGERNRL